MTINEYESKIKLKRNDRMCAIVKEIQISNFFFYRRKSNITKPNEQKKKPIELQIEQIDFISCIPEYVLEY